jgi:hypothetical protein
MAVIDQLAEAALEHDSLQTRALAQDLLRTYRELCDVPPPDSRDPRVQSVAAALVELLAQRRSQEPPTWSAGFGPLDEPFHLLQAATRMPRLRAQCETESPLPLRKRNLYAPSNFLTFA